MLFDPIISRFSEDLAIDLGTANTLVCVKGKGVVADNPISCVVKGSEKALDSINVFRRVMI